MPDQTTKRLADVLNQEERSPDDIRFQFEIIKELAASVREQTRHLTRMQEQQTDIIARLERIESKETAEQLAACMARVELLEADYHRRTGRDTFLAAVFKSPLVAWIVVAAGIVYTMVKDKLP